MFCEVNEYVFFAMLLLNTLVPCGIIHQTLEVCTTEPLRPREQTTKENRLRRCLQHRSMFWEHF